MTADLGPELTDLIHWDTELLRHRVHMLPEHKRQQLLAQWAAQGLPSIHPDVLGPDGRITPEQWKAIEALLMQHEELVDDDVRRQLGERVMATVPDPWLANRIFDHMQVRPSNLLMTTGRVWQVGHMLDNLAAWWPELPQPGLVDAMPDKEPEAPPVEVPTHVVTTPHSKLDEVPTGTIADLKEWIGDDPERAKAATQAEITRRKTPRKGVLDYCAHVHDEFAGKQAEEDPDPSSDVGASTAPEPEQAPTDEGGGQTTAEAPAPDPDDFARGKRILPNAPSTPSDREPALAAAIEGLGEPEHPANTLADCIARYEAAKAELDAAETAMFQALTAYIDHHAEEVPA